MSSLKKTVRVLVLLALVLAVATIPSYRSGGDAIVVAPGKVNGLPPGVHRVSGACSGKIAMTPAGSSEAGEDYSYPLIYDCRTRSFEVPDLGQRSGRWSSWGDLTLTSSGYYVNAFRSVDMARLGRYVMFDRGGSERRRVEIMDMDVHDFILEDDSVTYMKYVPDRHGKFCGRAARVELALAQENSSGRTLWTWSSSGRLRPEWKVTEVDVKRLHGEPGWKKLLRPIRDCYTTLALKAFKFETPKAYVLPGEWPLLQLESNDYIHANSIDWIGKNRNMLVSARHLDTVFVVDRASGSVLWALGGPKSRMTARRPLDDPGGGFSHQHSAIVRNNILYLFDNGNNHPGRPTRIVAYDVDADDLRDARFRYQFAEPNGLRRPAWGSVQPLSPDLVLVGWGSLPDDARSPQRAVSIFDVTSGAEIFSIDFSPGWSSYRAKHAD